MVIPWTVCILCRGRLPVSVLCPFVLCIVSLFDPPFLLRCLILLGPGEVGAQAEGWEGGRGPRASLRCCVAARPWQIPLSRGFMLGPPSPAPSGLLSIDPLTQSCPGGSRPPSCKPVSVLCHRSDHSPGPLRTQCPAVPSAHPGSLAGSCRGLSTGGVSFPYLPSKLRSPLFMAHTLISHESPQRPPCAVGSLLTKD